MRSSILQSLALGLVGLDFATGSVCKPRSSRLDSSSVPSTVGSETSTLVSSLASSAIFASTTTDTTTTDTTTTDAVTTEDTTVTETASTLELTATETATTEASTAETSATSGTVSESLDVTTTVEATTTVPTSTALPLFRVLAEGGPTDGLPLLADRNGYATLLYDNSEGDFSDAFFAVDPVTHYLMLDDQQPICGYFGDDNGLATLARCSTGPTSEEVKITCQVPEATGVYLQCSVPAVVCGSECVPNGETWSTIYTAQWGADVRYSANLGSDSVEEVDKTPLVVEFRK